MDVNGTRFHLLYGRADWLGRADAPDPDGLEWHAPSASLGLRGRPFVYPRRAETPPSLDQRRGAARDHYGNWYWIDTDRTRIMFCSPGGSNEIFWSGEGEPALACPPASEQPEGGFVPSSIPAAPTPWVMHALAVTDDHYLVVASGDPKGLLVFDLRAGGPPTRLVWPAEVPFAPWDMTAASGGGVWILDARGRAAWWLDRHFRFLAPHLGPASHPPVPTEFQPVDGATTYEAPEPPSARITAPMAIPLANAVEPIAIESLPDGSIMVLDADPALAAPVVRRYRGAQLLDEEALDAVRGVPEEVRGVFATGFDLAVVATLDQGGAPAGRAYVVAPDGNQVFAFDLTLAGGALSLVFHREFFPMRHFGGKALVASLGAVHYDGGERWRPLVSQPHPLFESQATMQLPAEDAAAPAFDGLEPDCVWHRLVFDACMPGGTEVRVKSRAADREEELAQLPWQEEPVPYQRGDGAELPLYRPARLGPPDRTGTYETLFQHARGRFLQLRLSLIGTTRATPRLRALRIHYPRFSYLERYLPAVFRDNASSASFLDRYLANVEGFFTVLEDRIAHVEALFDTRTVPADLLPWLAGWFGVMLDHAWPERTRRLFLAHAPQMLRERATRAGMLRSLRLALEPCVDESLFEGGGEGGRFSARVVERYLTRSAPGVVFGDPTDLLGPGSSTDVLAWTPAQGAEPLHARYREHLAQRYGDIAALNAGWGTRHTAFDDGAVRLTPLPPAGAAQAADWRRFMAGALGFTYAEPSRDDVGLYRDFLARRYRQIGDLNTAWGRSGADSATSFQTLSFPVEFPAGGVALQDWIQFTSLVLPTQRNAHRFTVLVPVALDDTPPVQLDKLEHARRVADVAKPAHSVFDVRAYWAAFRVGDARLGFDTLLGHGSRFAALLLGRGLLGGSTLEFNEPWNTTGRIVVERDRVTFLPRGRQQDPRIS